METEKINEKLDKDSVVRRLGAIARQLSFMSDSEFNDCVKDGHFDAKFDYYCCGEPAKIQTSIIMTKTK